MSLIGAGLHSEPGNRAEAEAEGRGEERSRFELSWCVPVAMEEGAESCSSGIVDSGAPGGGRHRRRRRKVDVFNEVLRRLKEVDHEEASRPGFEDDLWAHFNRLPIRYALDVNVETAEDVLLHKRLLHMAKNPATRPAIEVRLRQVSSVSRYNCGDSVHSTSPGNVDACTFNYKRRQSIHPLPDFGLSSKMEVECEGTDLPTQNWDSSTSGSQCSVIGTMHEVTISTNDKRKFLSQLTSSMSEIGLNIQEAHAFSTIDGYSLDVFSVDGWERETEELKEILKEKMLMIEHPQLKFNGSFDTDKQKHNGNKSNHNHVHVSSEGKDVWEIDVNVLGFEKKIASGSYGELYKGTFLSQDVAIKALRSEHLNKAMQREFAQEVYIMRKIRHKNIVQFIGACTRPPRLCIVTEYMSGGSLFDFLHKQNDVLKLSTVLRLAIDVSKGMNYLHKNNIIHRDLKAANLLMDENEVVKIADFGIARVQTQSGVMTAETGTYRWMAPEVIEHRPYDHKADVFSFGIVLWELLTGKLPYEDLTPLQAAIGVVHKGLRPTIPERTHPELEKLLNKCWERESSLRPEFSEIVETLQRIARTAQD
ncbi:uncharacterized protein J3R85_007640 [Psidium guajava]|nr:uncharacterized protein J3R85_007640 [Psidium guajava]